MHRLRASSRRRRATRSATSSNWIRGQSSQSEVRVERVRGRGPAKEIPDQLLRLDSRAGLENLTSEWHPCFAVLEPGAHEGGKHVECVHPRPEIPVVPCVVAANEENEPSLRAS